MDFMIADAYAQTNADAGGGLVTNLVLLVGMVAIFYFLLIRPQQKKTKEHRRMVTALAKGDEVITNGGILGRITKVNDGFLHVEISDGIEVRVQRIAIAQLLPKGTVKSI